VKAERAGGMTEVEEHLPSKYKALSLIPRTTKNKTRQNKTQETQLYLQKQIHKPNGPLSVFLSSGHGETWDLRSVPGQPLMFCLASLPCL
jgi:hypothetical protein